MDAVFGQGFGEDDVKKIKIFLTAPTLFLFFVVLIVWSRKVSYVIMTMKNSEFDDEIVEIFVNDYRPLCICAEKIVRNQEEAKDIVSDVFLKLCINRNRIQISQNKKGYMYQCVRNSCLNYLEHKKMMKNYAQAQNEKLEACDDNNPLTAMISKEELFKIEQAMNSLPPKCKQVFILAKFDRLSYQEIADQLKISINTVNRQITIAKDELGKMLGNT